MTKKLTKEFRDDLIHNLQEGKVSQKDLALHYGISESRVSQIKREFVLKKPQKSVETIHWLIGFFKRHAKTIPAEEWEINKLQIIMTTFEVKE